MGEVSAHQPIEPSTKRAALQAKLLAEGLEALVPLVVVNQIQIVEIGILAAVNAPVAPRSDRRQTREAKVPIYLARQAPILDVRPIIPARGDARCALLRIIHDRGAEASQESGHRAG